MTTSNSSTTHRVIDPRSLLDRAIAAGGTVIAAVRHDQLTAPTPCPEMDVRAMLSHLVGVLDRIAALGNDEDPFSVIETHAPDDEWSDAWATSGTHAVEAWRDDAVLERPMALPWIQGNGAEVLTSYFSELTVHTWDLATATGQQPHWDDTVVTAALEARQILPAENRRAVFEEFSVAMGLDAVAIPFAEAVPVPADAPRHRPPRRMERPGSPSLILTPHGRTGSTAGLSCGDRQWEQSGPVPPRTGRENGERRRVWRTRCLTGVVL